MPVSYRLFAYDTAHTLKHRVADFSWVRAVARVNAPGLLEFGLPGEHALLADLADNWELELHRSLDGLTWTTFLVTRYRDGEWRYERGGPIFAGVAIGIKALLGTRIVNWPAGTANRSQFLAQKGETVLKTLVDYNAGPNATTGNGRKRTGTISGLTVQTDAAGGNTITVYCHGKNVLEVLQNEARGAGVDFDLVKTGAGAYQFRTYAGQLGTDRSATLTFAMARGNMAKPVYRIRRANERTVACVWGQGEGADRDYVTRTGPDYSAIRDSEMLVDARHVPLGDTAGLQGAGDAKLQEQKASEELTFDAVQIESSRFGVHYFLGDKVTAINPFNGTSSVLKVWSVQAEFQPDGAEVVRVEIGTP